MTRKREQIVLELKKLRAELRQATPSVAIAKLDRIDQLLDERLDQRGAHPADCGCWECRKLVSDALTLRHLGEMLDPRDQAGADEWGTAG